MSINYKFYTSVVSRLKEYRKKMNLTQKQMGLLLNVTQSHYCKLESGMKIIAKKSLLQFSNNGGDVQWLITGKTCQDGIFNDYFAQFKDEQSKVSFLEISIWTIKQGLKLSHYSDVSRLHNVYKIMYLMFWNNESYSVWNAIRDVESLTQMEMADILEINVKQYRRLEKGISEEDTTILLSLYIKLNYSPLLLIERDMWCINELNAAWNLFSTKMQNILKKYIDTLLELINYDI